MENVFAAEEGDDLLAKCVGVADGAVTVSVVAEGQFGLLLDALWVQAWRVSAILPPPVAVMATLFLVCTCCIIPLSATSLVAMILMFFNSFRAESTIFNQLT